MKKEARLLLQKGVNSLVLSFEYFNRPWDRGRVEAVLIFLDHAFEMLLKAAIIYKGGRIREPRAKQTIGFDHCVRKGLTEGKVKFLSEEQALLLQMINSLRDAAQHHFVDISEQHLYIQAQAGLTLFRDLYKHVFDLDLGAGLPERVLPISTSPPIDLTTLFDNEVDNIRKMLGPRKRKHIEATAKLRALAIVEGTLNGERVQPTEGELTKLRNSIRSNWKWEKLFPGVASISLTAEGTGPSIDLRITKRTGAPIHIVPEGTPGALVVAVRRVDELGYYNLSRDQLAEKVGLSGPKTTAMIWHLGLREDNDCYKAFQIGKTIHRRYSQQAIGKLKDALKETSIDEIWNRYQSRD